MFTDPLTRVGGEKCSYHLPTYEALKGVCKSIYWKPTFIWYVDEVRLMRRIRTQTKGMKPLDYTSSGNTLAIYTYLTGDARGENPADLTDGPGVEYQVRAHFEWNLHQASLEADRVDGKHFSNRATEPGTRRAARHFSWHTRLPGLCRALCIRRREERLRRRWCGRLCADVSQLRLPGRNWQWAAGHELLAAQAG